MEKASREAMLQIPVVVAIGAALGWAGSQGGARVGDVSLFALCGLICFGVNWAVFVPAYLAQTDRFFDLTGGLTYLTVVATGVALGGGGARSLLLALLIGVWAVRLSSFLFLRVSGTGGDRRFEQRKRDFWRFLQAWTLQGLWVFFTAACALAALSSPDPQPLGAWAAVGAVVWLVGFAVEVTADRQKSAFRADPANRDRFIQSGLWAWSRHPNYAGEIVLWGGIALIALPELAGWRWVTLLSPVFVYVLLAHISGIPLLEFRAKRQWKDDPEYQAYERRTPTLWPRPPASD
jgi:steroid 5-alpha reductase family enzyme